MSQPRFKLLWIAGSLDDESFLKSHVSSLGEFKEARDQPHKSATWGEWLALVTLEQLDHLDQYWGRFIWSTDHNTIHLEDDPLRRPGDTHEP